MGRETDPPLTPPEGGKGGGGLGALLRATERSIRHVSRLKEYNSGAWELMAATRPIFREPGWELTKDPRPLAALSTERSEGESAGGADAAAAAEEGAKGANISRAARRAAARVRDLALANPFRWFVTLTLDPAKIDRYDVKEVTRHLSAWLDNMVRRHGAAYVLVPELHKDGAIHFHGLVNDCEGFVPSGTWKVPGKAKPKKPRSKAEAAQWAAEGAAGGFHEVYNWDAWPWGFSTAVELWGEYDAAVNYVCKYIRKQTYDKKIAGRWYFHGGKLQGPRVTYLDYDLDQIKKTGADLHTFTIQETGVQIGILRGKSRDAKSILQKPECKTGENPQAQQGPEGPRGCGVGEEKVSAKGE